ncbi:MAG: hypothetical protein ACYC6P_10280 [Ignavibacteriaceae bacterium]
MKSKIIQSIKRMKKELHLLGETVLLLNCSSYATVGKPVYRQAGWSRGVIE